MSEATKNYFAPLPNRVMTDDRMTGRHYRVLCKIAAHHRFGNNGQGCTLSQSRMAAALGMKQPHISAVMKDLEAWGYIARIPHPSRKQRIMSVICYDPAADKAALATPPEARSLPPADPAAEAPTHTAGGIGTPPEPIPSAVYKRDSSEDDKIDADQSAPIGDFGLRDGNSDKPLCARISMFERALRAGRYRFNLEALQEYHNLLDEIFMEYDNGTPEFGMAYRVLEILSEQIVEAADADPATAPELAKLAAIERKLRAGEYDVPALEELELELYQNRLDEEYGTVRWRRYQSLLMLIVDHLEAMGSQSVFARE